MDDLNRAYHQWRDAEEDDNEAAADAAFEAVFRASAPAPRLTTPFLARTMAAVSATREADAIRARRLRRTAVWGGSAAATVGAYFGAGFAFTIVSSALVATLDFLVQAVVTVATAREWSLWSMLSTIGRASAAVISSPTVTVAIIAIQALAVAALVMLQRLLGPEAESFE